MSKDACIIIVDLESLEGHHEKISDYIVFAAKESMKEEGCTVFDVM